MGAGRATASPYCRGLGIKHATPPSPRPPPAPAHHDPGTSGHPHALPTAPPGRTLNGCRGSHGRLTHHSIHTAEGPATGIEGDGGAGTGGEGGSSSG